jgi:hypothetical protein
MSGMLVEEEKEGEERSLQVAFEALDEGGLVQGFEVFRLRHDGRGFF